MSKKITVEFEINDENLKLLKEVNLLLKEKTGIENSIEKTFDFIMRTGSNYFIKEKLEYAKENFSSVDMVKQGKK